MWWTGVILGFFLGLIITQSFGGALLFAIIGGFVGFAISKSQARKRGQIEPGAKSSPYFSPPDSGPDSRETKSLRGQFLVELAASGTLQRIVSFIGVGLMLLFVGYVAPLPPRKNEPASAPRSTNSV